MGKKGIVIVGLAIVAVGVICGVLIWFVSKEDTNQIDTSAASKLTLVAKTIYPTQAPINQFVEIPTVTLPPLISQVPTLSITPTIVPATTTLPPDPNLSSLIASPAAVLADGNSKAEITVKLVSAPGNPLLGATLTLNSNGEAKFQSTHPGSNITNHSGAATFMATSQNPETVKINVMVQYDNKTMTLTNLGTITFNPLPTEIPTITPTATPSASPTP